MTVSRVLNGHPHVTSATRQRVERAVVELGYHANMAARTLAGGRSHVIGAISVQPETWGPSRTVFAIEAAAQAAGQLVSFKTAHEPSASAMREAIDELRGGNAEGIIVVARLRAAVEALRELDLPVPLLATYPTADLPLSVGVDQELGARLATRHLLSLGHERVIHVRGPKGWIDADDRARGWRKELRSSGATGRTINGDWTPRSGYEAGREIAGDDSATAVFVANDQMALGVQLRIARGRAQGARRRQRRRVRRRAGSGFLHPAPHHRSPGLRRARSDECRASARRHRRSRCATRHHRSPTRRAGQHRASAL